MSDTFNPARDHEKCPRPRAAGDALMNALRAPAAVHAYIIAQVSDGQEAYSWMAYDAESGVPLLGTWSLYPDSCLAYTRERYPDAVFFASERTLTREERL